MRANPAAHDHRASLDATVAFINTLEGCTTRGHGHTGDMDEHLDAPEAAIRFLAQQGVAHADDLAERAALDAGWLDRVRSVRAAFREVFDAEVQARSADRAAVERVNAVLRHRPLIELTPGEDGCGVGHRHVGDPTDEALARLAEPLVEAIAASATDRWRICANDHCRWVFVDESRTGRRRWCDMATCGNRAKAARHRARLKGQDPIRLLHS